MTPLTLFVSVLLYMAAILCPGVKIEKKTGELQRNQPRNSSLRRAKYTRKTHPVIEPLRRNPSLMDPLTAGIISAGANTVGGLLQNQNSRANADHAFNQSRSIKHRSSKEVKDLRAAGLNPILSALGSGASTPGATPSDSSNLGEGISKGMDTAIAVKSMNKELQTKDATIGNLNADTDNKEHNAILSTHKHTKRILMRKIKLSNQSFSKKLFRQ